MVAVGRALNIATSSRPIRAGPSSPATYTFIVDFMHSTLRKSSKVIYLLGELKHAGAQA